MDSSLSLLKDHPEFSQLIKLAIEKSVQEWISPVIERAIKIAITTCEQDRCCGEAWIASQALRCSSLEPKVITYSVAISACDKDRYDEKAWILLQELRRSTDTECDPLRCGHQRLR